MSSFKRAWSNIDAASDPGAFVRYMDEVSPLKAHDAGRLDLTLDLLRLPPGARVLDVGCGTGEHARLLAARIGACNGSVVGVDNSATMIEAARRRAAGSDLPVSFQVADAHTLPFDSGAFDAGYALGLLEVVDRPAEVLAEMARVTRSGGRVAAFAPDVGAWTIDAADRPLTRRIVDFICDHELNGWVGRQLPRLAVEAGLLDVRVVATPFVMRDLGVARRLWLDTYVEHAVAAGAISTAEAAAWLADLEARDAAGQYLHAGLVFAAGGRKP